MPAIRTDRSSSSSSTRPSPYSDARPSTPLQSYQRLVKWGKDSFPNGKELHLKWEYAGDDEAQCSASLTITLPGSSTSLPTISTKPDQLFLKKTDAREYLSSVAIEDDYRLLEDALVELMLTQDAEEEVGESLSSLESIARFFRLLVKLASSVCAKVKEWCSEILRILKSLFSRGVQAVRSVPAAEWKALASFLVGVYKSDNRAGYIGKKAFLKALDLLKKLMLNPQVRNAVNGVLEGLARNNVFDLNAFVERMGGQTGEWARDTFLTAV